MLMSVQAMKKLKPNTSTNLDAWFDDYADRIGPVEADGSRELYIAINKLGNLDKVMGDGLTFPMPISISKRGTLGPTEINLQMRRFFSCQLYES